MSDKFVINYNSILSTKNNTFLEYSKNLKSGYDKINALQDKFNYDNYLNYAWKQVVTKFDEVILKRDSIDDWWTNYLENVRVLENQLPDNLNFNFVKIDAAKYYVDHSSIIVNLPTVSEYSYAHSVGEIPKPADNNYNPYYNSSSNNNGIPEGFMVDPSDPYVLIPIEDVDSSNPYGINHYSSGTYGTNHYSSGTYDSSIDLSAGQFDEYLKDCDPEWIKMMRQRGYRSDYALAINTTKWKNQFGTSALEGYDATVKSNQQKIQSAIDQYGSNYYKYTTLDLDIVPGISTNKNGDPLPVGDFSEFLKDVDSGYLEWLDKQGYHTDYEKAIHTKAFQSVYGDSAAKGLDAAKAYNEQQIQNAKSTYGANWYQYKSQIDLKDLPSDPVKPASTTTTTTTTTPARSTRYGINSGTNKKYGSNVYK